MKYRITIDEVSHADGEKYPSYREVYQQEVEDLVVQNLVAVINSKT